MRPPEKLAPHARYVRIDGDRRVALTSLEAPEAPEAICAFDFVDPSRAGAEDVSWLGEEPLLVRPLRAFGSPPLLLPFARSRRTGVREITAFEPRMTRLWERFSVDVGVAVERSAAFLAARAFERPGPKHRVLVLEDGDRYAMRALCMFTSEPREASGKRVGTVLELLHDRSVTGMRAASHLLGLAVREMSDAGAEAVTAWSLPHSGSFPMFVRHGFLPVPRLLGATKPRVFGVRSFEPELSPIVVRREHWYLSSLDDSATEAAPA